MTEAGVEAYVALHMEYAADRYGLILHHVQVGEDFVPDVGFLRRKDMVRYFAQARFSPRPRRFKGVRKFTYQGTFAYVENHTGFVETRERGRAPYLGRSDADHRRLDASGPSSGPGRTASALSTEHRR